MHLFSVALLASFAPWLAILLIAALVTIGLVVLSHNRTDLRYIQMGLLLARNTLVEKFGDKAAPIYEALLTALDQIETQKLSDEESILEEYLRLVQLGLDAAKITTTPAEMSGIRMVAKVLIEWLIAKQKAVKKVAKDALAAVKGA